MPETTPNADAVTPELPRLALRPKEAAKALGIGERLLWSLTNRGEVSCVRMGRRVVYPVVLLNQYLAGAAKGACHE